MEILAIGIESWMGFKQQTLNFTNEYHFVFSFENFSANEDELETIRIKLKVVERNGTNVFAPYVDMVTAIIGKNGSGKTRLIDLIKILKVGGKPDGGDIMIAYKFNNAVYVDRYKSRHDFVRLKKLEFAIENEESTGGVNIVDCVNAPVGTYDTFEHLLSETNLLFYSGNINRYNDKQLQSSGFYGNTTFYNASIGYLLRESLSYKRVEKHLESRNTQAAKDDFFDLARLFYQDRLKQYILFCWYLKNHPDLRSELESKITMPDSISLSINFELTSKFIDDLKLSSQENVVLRNRIAAYLSQIANKENRTEAFVDILRMLLVFYLTSKSESEELHKRIYKLFNDIPFHKDVDWLPIFKLPEFSKRTPIFDVYDKLLRMIPSLTMKISDFWSSPYFFQLIINDKDKEFDFMEGVMTLSELAGEDLVTFSGDRRLSSGEEALATQFAELANYGEKLKKRDSLILIDEGELFLHPQWQKAYFFTLLKFFYHYRSPEFKCQLIITSHSPFILSEMPKENVIFLDKDEKTKESIVKDSDLMEETFASNILSLLADAFFLDSLMGDFAHDRIQKIIDYISNNDRTAFSKDDEVNKMIEKIGEPLIKDQLIKMMRNREFYTNRQRQ